MLPTTTLPLAPDLGPTGMGTLLVLVACGALVALLVGLALHQRDPATTTIALPDGEAGASPEKRPGRRVSA